MEENETQVEEQHEEVQEQDEQSAEQPQTKEEYKFTDKDMAELRRKEARARKKQQLEYDKKIAELNEKLEKLGKKEESLPAPQGKKGDELLDSHAKVELLSRKLEQIQRDHENERKTFQQQLKEAEEKSRKQKLEFELTEALNGKTCDIKVAKRYFKDDIKWDDLDERYVVEDENGRTFPLKEGVDVLMPDFLRVSRVQRGGSGGVGVPGSSSSKKAHKHKQLKAAVEKAKEAAKQQGTSQARFAWQKAKRELEQFERENGEK